jgi:hypothetical protein
VRDDVTFDPAQQSTASPGEYTRTTDFEVRTTRLDDDRSDFDYDYRSGPEADDDAGVAVRLGQALMIVSGAALVALAARQGTRRFRSGSEAQGFLDRGRTDEWSGALRAHAEETGAAAPIQTAINRHSHWVAKSPIGFRAEWDAEIVEEQEGRLLSWRSLPGAQVHNAGTVHFEEAPGGRGTVVRVNLEYKSASSLGQMVGKVLKPLTKQEVREDLRRLKMLLETEEIPTIEGQTHGTRSLIGRIHNPF